MPEPPTYQRIFKYVCYTLAGVIGLGTLLDSLSNAITLIVPYVTYLGTPLLIFFWLLAEYVLRKSPLRWVAKGGRHIRLQRLGAMPRCAILGAILLLWVPRTVDRDQKSHTDLAANPMPSPTQSTVNKSPDHVNNDNSVIKPYNTPANDTPVVPSSPTDAQKLVNDIQVSNSAITSLNFFLSYAAAHKISHSLNEHLHTADLSSLEMEAEMFGFYAVISVTSYRQFGYIMFLDSRNNELVLEDDNFEFDIRDVQFINFGENSLPNAIVEVQYTTSHGTGTYCSSVKIYTLTGDQVRLSLDKPYFEYNTGWGAFAEEYVEFKSRNIYEINPKTSVCQIRTIGIAVVRPFDENDEQKASNKVTGGKIIAYRALPREVYIWNPRSNQFEQKEGRIVARQGYMTSIYADYATPTGDWFHKPESINKNKSLLDLLYDESQTGEIP